MPETASGAGDPQRVVSRETERNLDALEQDLAALAERCQQLRIQRQTLADECATLNAEREALETENRHYRSRIDAMVARLKGLQETS